MVWPIRVITEVEEVSKNHFTGHQDLYGYLAVDTMLVDSFREEVDRDVGALMADALHMFLSRVDSLQDEAGNDAEPEQQVDQERPIKA
jgi:hypothetical protein